MPGATSLRVMLHRARGVRIGKGVWIGYDVILETSRPDLISVDDGASIGMRVTIVGHFRESQGVEIGRDAFVGPAAVILPGVTIGPGAVVTAGSVVTRSVPAMTMVQGNPAVPVARCGVALGPHITLKEFTGRLKPLSSRAPAPQATPRSSTGGRGAS